jgi:hypothetical protein
MLDDAAVDPAADCACDELAEEDPHDVRTTSSANIPARVFTHPRI